jgi:D-beta-D-heptose 7-phosphate kinase/D-beta-D-heptose 1-phosphate adenosyltransferase
MADPKEIQGLVQDFAARLRDRRVSVAVVGDMILDSAIEGIPGGRHPDIAVPLVREATSQESIGGAANIALALARLGAQVALFGVVGSDLHGRQLENLLDRQPFATYLVSERGWPTPYKEWIYQRQESRLSLIQRIDFDRPLAGKAREELVGEFRARCPASVEVVILADHDLGSVGPESLPIIGLAKERQAQLVAIPRSVMLCGQPLDAIVINTAEMRNLCRNASQAEPELLALGYAREHAQHVFLTALEKGIYVCPAASTVPATLIPGYPLENPQWMGARDMATAIVAVGLALKLNLLDTGRLANAFRHLIACQRGNGRVVWRDIYRFVGLPD